MRLTQLLRTSFLLAVLITFIACNKAKRDKWILADIKSVNKTTGEPVDCELTMFYQTEDGEYGSGIQYPTYDSIVLGSTESGYYRLEKKFDSKITQYHIRGEGIGEFYSENGYNNYAYSNEMANSMAFPNEDEDLVVQIQPISRINVHLMNDMCNGFTDTVWISYKDFTTDDNTFIEHVFTGCMDDSQKAFTCWTPGNYIQFFVTTKKNGVEDSFYPSFENLKIEEYTDVTINY